jgi:hypothetical protein
MVAYSGAMPNPEHLAILKQGVEAWNRWRVENPEVYRVDLSKADLSGTDLRNANLSGANLSDANLKGTVVSFADFSGANLIAADLSRLQCMGTSFNGADLTRATLREAFLFAVTFGFVQVDTNGKRGLSVFRDGTTLATTDFTEAQMGYCTFCNVDLGKAKGLNTVTHSLPSSVDMATLYASKGRIPNAFLRGCGAAEALVTFQRGLRRRPVKYHSCFISYSSKDQRFADRIYAALQKKGVRCWFAPADLKIGDPFRQRIDESIRFHDKLLLILSQNSANSSWVQDEVEAAFEREQRENRLILAPIRIDDAVMNLDRAWVASIRRTRQIGDFSKWRHVASYQAAFQRLLRDLKAEGS